MERALKLFVSMQNLVASAATIQSVILQLIAKNRKIKKMLLSSGDVMCTNWRSGIKKAKIRRTANYWVRPGRVQVKSYFFHAVPVPSVATFFALFALGTMMILNRVQD